MGDDSYLQGEKHFTGGRQAWGSASLVSALVWRSGGSVNMHNRHDARRRRGSALSACLIARRPLFSWKYCQEKSALPVLQLRP